MVRYFGSCGIPAYGPNAVTWPLVYDQSVSVTQQIAYMMGAVNQIHEMMEWVQENAVTQPQLDTAVNALQTQIDKLNEKLVDDLAAQLAQLEALISSTDEKTRADFAADQAAQSTAITAAYRLYTDTEVHELDLTLRELIGKILDQNAVWDVTHGNMQPSKPAMREVWYWLTPDAYSLAQIREYNVTVEEINAAGLTARGLATISARAVPREGWQPADCFVQ